MKKLVLITFSLLISINIFCQNKITVDIGDQAYNFIGFDEKGKEIQITDYKNSKYILLNFTATYCGPCWGTYNQMNEVQKTYQDKLKVISIHWDNEKEQWTKMAEKAKIKFECTSIWEAKEKEKISDIYKIDGWPYFFIIDKNGIIIEKWFGNKEKKLKRVLKKRIK